MFLAFIGAVRALSSTGDRLLVVTEEASEREKYSQFWGDLEGALGTIILGVWGALADYFVQGEAISSHSNHQRTTSLRYSGMASELTTMSSSFRPSRKVWI